MKTVGIVGLGNMRMGMARNLLLKGFAVRGYARRDEVREAFAKHGGTTVASVTEVARGADAVFFMVLDEAQVTEIADDGLFEALEPGAALIVRVTIGPSAVRRLAQRLQGRDVQLIDAPVSGGQGRRRRRNADADGCRAEVSARAAQPRAGCDRQQHRSCGRCARRGANRDRVLGGKTYAGGALLGPGRVQAGIRGKETFIGELGGALTDRVRAVADAFRRAGLLTLASDRIVDVM